MTISATRPRPAGRLVGEAGCHGAMLAIMAVAMLPGSPAVVRLAGAAALAVLAVVLAPRSRRHPHVRPMLVDLTAMTLALALHPAVGAGGTHGHSGSGIGWEPTLVIAIAWLAARLASTRDNYSAVTGVITAAQLVVMLAMSLP